MKLNLGSNNKRILGYTNVDILDLPNVDIKHDLTSFPWPFITNSVEEILMQEFLEHISWRSCQEVINECYRILQPRGALKIQVPDIEAMCLMAHRQCACVPNKAKNYEDYKADPKCEVCFGKAEINPERWHVAFVGAQKHPYDYHKNVFTADYLTNILEKANFSRLELTPNIYKLIITAYK